MSDKERIEKFLMTMKHLDNCLMYLRKMRTVEEMRVSIDDMKDTIQVVIEANEDQIQLDL